MASSNTLAARDYTETGYLQCSANNSNQGAKTVVLFVNGIGNDLVAAEDSRQKIEASIKPSCADCDFKKLYNQEDGFIDDVNELNLVGGWQLKAIDKAALSQYDYFIKDIPFVFKALSDAGYKIYEGYLLEELKNEIHLWLQSQRDLAKNGYFGSTVRFYSPQNDGSSFADALITKNAKQINSSETIFGKSTKQSRALEIYQQYLTAYKEVINARFMTEYRKLVVATYFSDRNLYANDAKASGSMTKSVEGLTTIINEYVLAGHKVIIIAHSQGNHVIDLAYSSLTQTKNQNFMNAIRVVGVASVSSTTPNNIYTTWDEDHTVLTLHSSGGNSPLQANFKDESPWYGYWDDALKDHSFINIYLSTTLKGKYTIPNNATGLEKFSTDIKNSSKIRTAVEVFTDLVNGSIASAVPIPATISTNSIITTQLRWEDYDDMDLHITEPDNGHIYYRKKTGLYGHLDLDDTNGLGPEHYYTDSNTKCNELNGKTWKFSIHQYPGGGSKAAIHLLIKIGDSAFLSRSFGLNNWPATNLDVGYVKFTSEPPCTTSGSLTAAGTTTGSTSGCPSGRLGSMYYQIVISDPNG
jgi:effector-binding domain-containing protein